MACAVSSAGRGGEDDWLSTCKFYIALLLQPFRHACKSLSCSDPVQNVGHLPRGRRRKPAHVKRAKFSWPRSRLLRGHCGFAASPSSSVEPAVPGVEGTKSPRQAQGARSRVAMRRCSANDRRVSEAARCSEAALGRIHV